MSEQDRGWLGEFIGDFRAFMRDVTAANSLLSEAWLEGPRAAFQELLSNPDTFEQVQATLRGDNDLDADLERLDADLERLGLTGSNLEIKLAGWRRARARLRDSLTRRALRSAFRWANTLLGSLAGAIGAAEALKELKEITENTYEDAADAEQE
jgi:hypothetical protein